MIKLEINSYALAEEGQVVGCFEHGRQRSVSIIKAILLNGIKSLRNKISRSRL